MNAPATEEIMRAVREKTERELDDLGEKMAAWLRKLIGVPVIRQRLGGRLTKTVIVRSSPGEPPRKDTGRLQASVQNVVYRAGGKVRLVVSTNTPYAEAVNRTRPYKRITEEYWKNQIEIRLSYSLNH